MLKPFKSDNLWFVHSFQLNEHDQTAYRSLALGLVPIAVKAPEGWISALRPFLKGIGTAA
jgi:hypothetical protein